MRGASTRNRAVVVHGRGQPILPGELASSIFETRDETGFSSIVRDSLQVRLPPDKSVVRGALGATVGISK